MTRMRRRDGEESQVRGTIKKKTCHRREMQERKMDKGFGARKHKKKKELQEKVKEKKKPVEAASTTTTKHLPVLVGGRGGEDQVGTSMLSISNGLGEYRVCKPFPLGLRYKFRVNCSINRRSRCRHSAVNRY